MEVVAVRGGVRMDWSCLVLGKEQKEEKMSAKKTRVKQIDQGRKMTVRQSGYQCFFVLSSVPISQMCSSGFCA